MHILLIYDVLAFREKEKEIRKVKKLSRQINKGVRENALVLPLEEKKISHKRRQAFFARYREEIERSLKDDSQVDASVGVDNGENKG